ncbi:hypothetical protein [Novosphingobium pentaromativorans]|nr:hypothetical protein [Novosphingobium pentaromativorans]
MFGIASIIANRPDQAGDAIEVLSAGLAFELRLPDVPAPRGHPGTGVPAEEVIRIVPGGHVAAGLGLLPVVKALAGLTANLALHSPVAAISWDLAGTRVPPREFSSSVLNWLAGGPFPARSLTALSIRPDGSVVSEGLVQFSGQEMHLVGSQGEGEEATMRLAVGVVDQLVRQGRLQLPQELTVAGTGLLAEPSQFEDRVWIWRKR